MSNERDPYLLAVGQGLQAWSGVEHNMFLIFIEVSETTREKAIIIYNAIVSFDARLKVLHKLMLRDLVDNPDLTVWNKLSARLSKFYKKRHELAHFEMYTARKTLPDGSEEVTDSFHPMSTLGSMYLGDWRTLTLLDIQERAGLFNALSEALVFFWSTAVARRYSEPKSGERVPDLIRHLRNLVAQTPEV